MYVAKFISAFLFSFTLLVSVAQAGTLSKGVAAWSNNDFKSAVDHLQPLADKGHAEAQFFIGRMHAAEKGFRKNTWVAVTWFAMAARHRHIGAQTALAEKYMSGTNGLTQNFVAAAQWYQKAADGGVAEVQFKLGQLYAEGRGVPRDFVTAHIWFNLAAAQGHNGAASKRSLISLKLTPTQIAQAQQLAGNWVKK